MAVRVSLGATRGRLLRQLLTESLLLSAVGAAASLLVAVWAGSLIETHFSYLFARLEVGFDWRVLVFTLGIALASGIAFGIAPALDSSRVAPFGSLQAEGARRTTGRSSLRTAFLIGQVALSVALLVGALVMVQSLGNLVDRPGYAQDEIAHYRLRPSRVKYDANRAAVYYGELTRRLAQVPGVRAVVYASFPPVRGWGATSAVRVLADGGPVPLVESVRNEVSPGFFRELGIAIARGREFDAQDRPGAPHVAVVNESLSRRLWGESDPLGRPVVVDEQTFTVVGVARDIYAARDGELPPTYVYLSHAQRRAVDARLFVRVEGDAEAMVPVLRRHLVEVDPNVHIGQEMTLRAAHHVVVRVRASDDAGPRSVGRGGADSDGDRTLRDSLVLGVAANARDWRTDVARCGRASHPATRHPPGYGSGVARLDTRCHPHAAVNEPTCVTALRRLRSRPTRAGRRGLPRHRCRAGRMLPASETSRPSGSRHGPSRRVGRRRTCEVAGCVDQKTRENGPAERVSPNTRADNACRYRCLARQWAFHVRPGSRGDVFDAFHRPPPRFP